MVGIFGLIELLPEWISSEEMELDGADGLSRLEDTGDWALDPAVRCGDNPHPTANCYGCYDPVATYNNKM